MNPRQWGRDPSPLGKRPKNGSNGRQREKQFLPAIRRVKTGWGDRVWEEKYHTAGGTEGKKQRTVVPPKGMKIGRKG